MQKKVRENYIDSYCKIEGRMDNSKRVLNNSGNNELFKTLF